MKLVMTLLVRDEEDILRANILYHLSQGVDFLIVMDNLSQDRTPEILQEFADRDLLRVLDQRQDNYAQAVWVTEMARLAKAEYGADWVINGDADEFWWPKSGSLKTSLQAIPPQYARVRAQRHNFLPCVEAGMTSVATMVLRHTSSKNSLGQPLPPKVCHRGLVDVDVQQGNHDVSAPCEMALFPGQPIEIFHYPIRSYSQFENKIVKGGAAYERSGLPPGIGGTWRQLYAEWKQGRLQEYFDREALTPGQADSALQNNEIVRDPRLSDYLREHAIPGA